MGRGSSKLFLVAAAGLAAASAAIAGGGASTGSRTQITVWSANTQSAYAYGGMGYGGAAYMAPAGAMITEQRDVEVGSNGEVRITGIAATVDPATVQLRSLTDPGGVSVTEQRFVPGANTPDEILSRHLGDPVTVVTPKGEVTGTLRSVDTQALVIEVGTGDQRRLQVMRRDGYVQDVRLPAGAGVDKPSLVWRLNAKKPGKQTVEVTYRADGLSWSADYLAIYDEDKKTLDFSAWATLKNATGTSFDGAELTLVSGAAGANMPVAVNPYMPTPVRQIAPPSRFTVPTPIHVGNGESVQVELMPPRMGAKARSVIAYEAVPDASASYQAYPATDCGTLNASVPGTGRAEVAVEVDVPTSTQLPDGRVRVFRRPAKGGDRLEAVNEDQLKATSGIARIKLAAHNEVVGERKATTCNIDERTRTIHEKLEVNVENKGKQAVDVVVREFLWRYPVWKIDPADESVKGTRAGPQTQEYRLTIPAGSKKSIKYAVVYTW